jgi:hypothetical protein
METTDRTRTTETLRRLRRELTDWLESRADVADVEVRFFPKREYSGDAQTLDNASADIDVSFSGDDSGDDMTTIRITLSAIDKAD